MDRTNIEGYRWVPAGMFHQPMGGLGVYVRYKPHTLQPIRVIEHTPRYVRLSCPDRDIVLADDAHFDHVGLYRPCDGTWDEYHHLSLSFPRSTFDMGIDFYMSNYTKYFDNDSISPKSREHHERLPEEPVIVSDSGGFQLSMGRLNYIDPHALVKWYNENTDIGIILDIPVQDLNEDDLRRFANVQARNTDIMMKEKRDGLDLMNVFHGSTLKEQDLFRSIVERGDIHRLAVGGVYWMTLMQSADRLLSVMESTHEQYDHVHVLGIFNLLQVTAMMRMRAKVEKVPKLLTSDASSHLQYGVNRVYAHHRALNEPMRMYSVGEKSGIPTNPNHILPCQCPVCTALKYFDVFNCLSNNMILMLLTHHNMFTFSQYVRMMTPIMEMDDKKAMKEILKAQMGNRGAFAEYLKTLDFIDEAAESGHKPARKKFQLYFGKGLLGTTTRSMDDMVEGIEEAPPKEVAAEHKVAILERYESEIVHKTKETKGAMKGHAALISQKTKVGGSDRKMPKKGK